MIINYENYRELVNNCGGSRPFNPAPREDNYFVYFDHRIELYNVATVNDRCQAPERLYMDSDVAYNVRDKLNVWLMSSKRELLSSCLVEDIIFTDESDNIMIICGEYKSYFTGVE